MTRNKKAVSGLIATVLIIGITIAAFGLVYTFIIPMVREGIQASQECANAQLTVVTEKGYTCYDGATTILDVQIGRGPKDSTISGIQVIYAEAGNSFIETLDSTDGIVQPNGEKVYNIDYTASGFTKVDYVTVAAVIQLGRKENVCTASPEVIVNACP